MKNCSKRISTVLMTLLLSTVMPGMARAGAADGGYQILIEPDYQNAGIMEETYGDVASMWENVYFDPLTGEKSAEEGSGRIWQPACLVCADAKGLYRVTEYYKRVSGLSEDGYAVAENMDGKWGVIDAEGNVIFDFKYDCLTRPNRSGFTCSPKWVQNMVREFIVLDIKNRKEMKLSDFPDKALMQQEGNFYWAPVGEGVTSGYTDRLHLVDKGLKEKYDWVSEYREINGKQYAVADGNVIDGDGNIVLSAETLAEKNIAIGSHHYKDKAMVSEEGLIPCRKYIGQVESSYTYDVYVDLEANIIEPAIRMYYIQNFHNGYAVINDATGSNRALLDKDGKVMDISRV